MYTQLFGNYLLSKSYISTEQLIEAMRYAKTLHFKLGFLAIHAGYMTYAEVDKIHILQTHIDKRFGELAVEEGYLTSEEVDELLQMQKPNFLLLGQAIVEKGYMSTKQFEDALVSYQSEYELLESDFTDVKKDKLNLILKDFYQLSTHPHREYYIEYIGLLFNNLIRFIGDDFTPFKGTVLSSYPTNFSVLQKVQGNVNINTAIDMDENTYIKFASRYADDDFIENDEYVNASVEDFLNLHNGLFAVNMSNDSSIELMLTPPIHESNTVISSKNDIYCIPISYSFGTLNILITI